MSEEVFDEIPYRHIGCWVADLAPARLLPRRVLSEHLDASDIVLVAAGVPFWAAAVPARLRDRLVVDFVTLFADESPSARSAAGYGRRVYLAACAPWYAWLERRCVRSARACVVPSPALAAWAQENGAGDVAVIPLAVDPQFRPSAAPREDAIVAVGRWNDPRKNLALLLQAYARATADQELPPLRIIGTRPTLEQLASTEVAAPLAVAGARVQFEGELPRVEVVEAVRHAMFLVMASDQEGFGLPVLEAMAAGCPVVTTRSGGVELLVTDGVDAMLVDVRDVDGLAAGIVAMATDGRRRDRLRSAGVATAERYTVAAVAGQLDAVVERVASSSSRVSRPAVG